MVSSSTSNTVNQNYSHSSNSQELEDKNLKALGISRDTWNIYQQTKKEYEEETGFDFSSNARVQSMSMLLFAEPGLMTTFYDHFPELAPKDYDSVKQVEPTNVIDKLQTRLKDIDSRDEAWVRDKYTMLRNSKEDKGFTQNMVTDYHHIAEFTKRLLEVLMNQNNAANDEPKSSISKNLIDIKG